MKNKKIIEIDFTQTMADDLNKIRKELGFDKFPEGHPFHTPEYKPCKLRCLYG